MREVAWRVATRADLPRVVDIYNQTIASRMVTADLDPVTVDSREAWFALHVPGFRPLWVVDGDRGLTAWLSFSSFYGRPAYDGTVEVSLYVDQAWRGRGIGAFLLGEAIREAPLLGIHTLLGFIFGHNEPSLSLFGRHGFARWGMLPEVAVLDGIARDLVIVGRRTATAAEDVG